MSVNNDRTTIYLCCNYGKDVNKTLNPVVFADTEKEALIWLSENGGGIYRNILHNFQFQVKEGDYK